MGADALMPGGWPDEDRLTMDQNREGGVERRRSCSVEFGESLVKLGSGLPGERHLVERLLAEALGGACHRTAAQRAIELDCGIVVGQRPDHQAAQPALGEVAPRRGEQPAAEPEALEFRSQIELVDFAVVGEAARAVTP